MFSPPPGAEWRYNPVTNTLLVIRDGFSGMNFAERYLFVINRRKGSNDVQVIAVTREEYEKLKDRIERLV